jgi:hypothetical protein
MMGGRIHMGSLILAGLFAAQIGIAAKTREMVPYWTVLPPTPTLRALDLEAFGDRQFLYRSLVLDLQNFGDTGGRITRMGDYDMTRVVAWLRTMDLLDKDADHHLKLAAQYFSMTQTTPDVALLVAYLQEQVALSPARHWRWLLDAIYLAQVKLHDLSLATAVADQLAGYDFPDMIIIARQIAAPLHEKGGDYKGAAEIMARALERTRTSAEPGEIAFMESYIAAMRARAAASAP